MISIVIISVAFLSTPSNAYASGNKEPKPRPSPKLIKACKNGMWALVKSMVEKGADVNIKDEYGLTALHLAAAAGNLEIVRLLIDKKAEVNQGDDNWETPLHRAMSKQIAEMLISAGADIDARDKWHYRTPLHLAAERGNKELCEFLISQGANIDAKDDKGYTPLRLCMKPEQKYIDTAILLIYKGADINSTDNYGSTPLHGACYNDNIILCKYLISKGANINAANKEGKKPIDVAEGASSIKCFLAANGAEYQPMKTHNLSEAIRNGDYLAAKSLIDEKAGLNQKDKDSVDGCYPIHLATAMDEYEILEMLINNGAEIDIKDNLKRSPLHYANSISIAELLLAHGANIDEPDIYLRTPLHSAIISRNIALVKFYISKGANLEAKDVNGDTPLLQAIGTPDIDIAELLINSGANVNSRNKHGVSPLYRAASGNSVDLCKLLILKGADVNAPDQYLETPLHQACYYERKDIIDLLLINGANPKAKNKFGQTPNDRAKQRRKYKRRQKWPTVMWWWT